MSRKTSGKLRIALVGTRGVPARYGGFETAVEDVHLLASDLEQHVGQHPRFALVLLTGVADNPDLGAGKPGHALDPPCRRLDVHGPLDALDGKELRTPGVQEYGGALLEVTECVLRRHELGVCANAEGLGVGNKWNALRSELIDRQGYDGRDDQYDDAFYDGPLEYRLHFPPFLM